MKGLTKSSDVCKMANITNGFIYFRKYCVTEEGVIQSITTKQGVIQSYNLFRHYPRWHN